MDALGRVAVALALSGVIAAVASGTDGLLVFAPHPDDEVLAAGGILYAAQQTGRDVAVVIVTNGDRLGTAYGLTRDVESVNALETLGLHEDQIVFLGYPDRGLLPLWNNTPAPDGAYVSPYTGRNATYAAPHGYGRADLHTVLFGAPAPYNGPALLADVEATLNLFQPAEVFTTGALDDHPDHRATFYAVRAALAALARNHTGGLPTLYTTIIHDPVHYPFDDFWPASSPRETPLVPGNDDVWPNPSATSGVPHRFDPTVPFLMPPSLPQTVLDWSRRAEWPVPAPMMLPDFGSNLKIASLQQYQTQASDVLWAHVKADEFFWAEPVGVGSFTRDVAREATATATSALPGYGPERAIAGTGDTMAAPGVGWLAANAPGAALQLTWRAPVTIDRVVLFDQPSLTDWITAAELLLGDGTARQLGPLANDGRGDEIVLDGPHTVGALTVVLESWVGTPGLAAIQVFGVVPEGDCLTDAECDDGDPCTRDACTSDGHCVHDWACRPQPVRGAGGCWLSVAGVPQGLCQDGDSACDQDGTADGACQFEVILCANAEPAPPRCRRDSPLVGVTVRRGQLQPELDDLARRLVARLPASGPTCVGPAPMLVRLPSGRRPVRRHVTLALTVGRRRLHTKVVFGCAQVRTRRARRGDHDGEAAARSAS
jgi:LmbE family N-acetylglucosaminyl deacetylase